jgi:hypothetical protein
MYSKVVVLSEVYYRSAYRCSNKCGKKVLKSSIDVSVVRRILSFLSYPNVSFNNIFWVGGGVESNVI